MSYRYWLLLGAVMLLLAGIEVFLLANPETTPMADGCYGLGDMLYPPDSLCMTSTPWQRMRGILMLLDGVPLAVLTLGTAGYGVRRALRWFGR